MDSLGQQILKNVSRSFYLSIRLLPQAMRESISLGYLLARASDTLADTEGLEAELRYDMLTGFSDILHGSSDEEWFTRLKQEVIPKQQHEGERVLLENLQVVLLWLSDISHEQRGAIYGVMKYILRGQLLDIERFELQKYFQFTKDEELEEYCYLVAGCVGEFWTNIGVLTVSSFSNIETSKLKKLGINYGKGLQLVNILRDLPSDLKQGRCYLPFADTENIQSLMDESTRWRKKARSYLADGQIYAKSLRVKRSRIATILPEMIGSRTLDLMDRADWLQLQVGIKVRRSEVYGCLCRSLLV